MAEWMKKKDLIKKISFYCLKAFLKMDTALKIAQAKLE